MRNEGRKRRAWMECVLTVLRGIVASSQNCGPHNECVLPAQLMFLAQVLAQV